MPHSKIKCVKCNSINLEVPRFENFLIKEQVHNSYRRCLDCKATFSCESCSICNTIFHAKIKDKYCINTTQLEAEFSNWSKYDGLIGDFKFCQFCSVDVLKLLLEKFPKLKLFDTLAGNEKGKEVFDE